MTTLDNNILDSWMNILAIMIASGEVDENTDINTLSDKVFAKVSGSFQNIEKEALLARSKMYGKMIEIENTEGYNPPTTLQSLIGKE